LASKNPLFANDLLCLFISSKSKKNGLPKLIVAGPLCKFDLGNQDRLNPGAALHHRKGPAGAATTTTVTGKEAMAAPLMGPASAAPGRF
jgi:hypothetical protein